MKESLVRVLDDKNMEFIDLLRRLGMPRNVAMLITYLSNVEEASSREIEMGSSLRQPEVSMAMRSLRERGWVEEREVKHEGKGRPMKVYSLKMPIDQILRQFEEQKVQESAQSMESIQRLKSLVSSGL
jgi:predicted transcriptional regulator